MADIRRANALFAQQIRHTKALCAQQTKLVSLFSRMETIQAASVEVADRPIHLPTLETILIHIGKVPTGSRSFCSNLAGDLRLMTLIVANPVRVGLTATGYQ